jgi:hypothetical protein
MIDIHLTPIAHLFRRVIPSMCLALWLLGKHRSQLPNLALDIGGAFKALGGKRSAAR